MGIITHVIAFLLGTMARADERSVIRRMLASMHPRKFFPLSGGEPNRSSPDKGRLGGVCGLMGNLGLIVY